MTELVLAARMQMREADYRVILPLDRHTVIRVDGRGFSRYTRGLQKPFDADFEIAMHRTAEALAKEVDGATHVYVQSDEISVVTRSYEDTNAQPWMGGVHSKIVSLSAATATAVFNKHAPRDDILATFDARAFAVSDDEVAAYLTWRRRDCERNAISMICDKVLGKKVTRGVGTAGRREMLERAGVQLHKFSRRSLYGRLYTVEIVTEDVEFVHKRTKEREVAKNVQRRVWRHTESPLFM